MRSVLSERVAAGTGRVRRQWRVSKSKVSDKKPATRRRGAQDAGGQLLARRGPAQSGTPRHTLINEIRESLSHRYCSVTVSKSWSAAVLHATVADAEF